MQWAEGGKYEGDWKDGRRHGRGVFYYLNGDVYDGEWQDDLKHGVGTYTFANTGAVYQGEWILGKQQGNGTVSYTNNMKFSGEFAGGNPNGEGTYVWLNGNLQEGNYVVTETREDEDDEDSPVTRTVAWVGDDIRLSEPPELDDDGTPKVDTSSFTLPAEVSR
eukprot:TRINITY_DN11059_c0_g1_i2.p2 TRINITY_DN11059_c0_g1~~TRINITY_DN11059_c0_g1_i2.p2  ORF type:complete len:163 (-),score=56.78 TRINITY_DN11059_c0_g1_i2:228-716(-)